MRLFRESSTERHLAASTPTPNAPLNGAAVPVPSTQRAPPPASVDPTRVEPAGKNRAPSAPEKLGSRETTGAAADATGVEPVASKKASKGRSGHRAVRADVRSRRRATGTTAQKIDGEQANGPDEAPREGMVHRQNTVAIDREWAPAAKHPPKERALSFAETGRRR